MGAWQASSVFALGQMLAVALKYRVSSGNHLLAVMHSRCQKLTGADSAPAIVRVRIGEGAGGAACLRFSGLRVTQCLESGNTTGMQGQW